MVATPYLLLFTAALLFCFGFGFSAKRCPNCGNTTVPYPLSTGPTCGDPSYKIRCTGKSLLFDTLNNSYRITSINPQFQRLVIRPAELLPDTCVSSDFVHHGIQLNNSLPFNITSSNTIMYLNCTENLLQSPLNCSSTSLCHTYINGSRDASPCEDGPICCTIRAGGSSTEYKVRVWDTGCRAYTSFVNLDPKLPLTRWPEPGLEIEWVLPQEPVCGSQVDCGGGGGGKSTCRPDPDEDGTSRCFCNDGLLWDPIRGMCVENSKCERAGDCGDSVPTSLIAGLTSSIVAALVAVIIVVLLYKRNKGIKKLQERLAKEREGILNASGGGRGAKLFTGKEIKRATSDFAKDNLLGAGGYGEVFKGILDDGTFVAVKCAKLGNTKGTDQVLNEVRILCQVNHRSLVRLLGCSVELEQPILVYEYIENGALLEHLQGRRSSKWHGLLNWTRRLQIAHDTAIGLAYLHFSAVPPIYHRDVKSSNILLDGKLNAKVSDFGLSRLAQTDLSHISTCAQGTLGYLDPEYYRNYQLTDKSDVYSFGVVLLELLTSQKAIDFNREADDVNLVVYVQRMVEEEKLMDVIDSKLKEEASTLELDTMKALGFLALGCLEDRRQNRPSMKEVTEEIEYIMSIAIGKDGNN
ncbi:putative Kinase [Quillaja saponaria]|uniref:Kinase n=1 Tax=Quillaja saponaria TaxID=32244 RepID=A0AAD7PLM5_QUISA|nr:putative Kinase [Quillaja saponaria]